VAVIAVDTASSDCSSSIAERQWQQQWHRCLNSSSRILLSRGSSVEWQWQLQQQQSWHEAEEAVGLGRDNSRDGGWIWCFKMSFWDAKEGWWIRRTSYGGNRGWMDVLKMELGGR